VTSSELLSKISPHIALQVQEQLVQLFTARGRRVIIIAGPTSVGKTALSLELAKILKGEIISADSMHVYRGMDIGTAKVSKKDREIIPHHLIDIRDIKESFTAHDFFVEATAAIDDVLSRDRVPIVVGGTGFYIHTLLYGPPSGPPSDPLVREKLEKEAKEMGIASLFERLKELDPEYAATVTPNDQHKIVRALEIIQISGHRVSDFSWKTRPLLPAYDFRCWFLYMPKLLLNEKLFARCDQMLKEGLVEEVIQLEKEGLRENSSARHAIGYRQTLDFLASSQTEKEYKQYVAAFKQASRHLAKRQFTWFRKEPSFRWVDCLTLSQQELIDIIASDYDHPIPIAPEPPPPPSPPAWTEG
jgi:tRNA dimethylallyltransferase